MHNRFVMRYSANTFIFKADYANATRGQCSLNSLLTTIIRVTDIFQCFTQVLDSSLEHMMYV